MSVADHFLEQSQEQARAELQKMIRDLTDGSLSMMRFPDDPRYDISLAAALAANAVEPTHANKAVVERTSAEAREKKKKKKKKKLKNAQNQKL